MQCAACKKRVRAVGEFGLCRTCMTLTDRAIRTWFRGIESDLRTLVKFDAYCAKRDRKIRPATSRK